MNPPEKENVTNASLMLWIMHRFASEFKDHAILKGGMQLMLLSSFRATNDLDYVFSPFKSKRDVETDLDGIFKELDGVTVNKSMHSNSGRYLIEYGKAKVQIEYNVSDNVRSEAITTSQLASQVGELPQVIRVMAGDVAFAHKLAAWNERRLMRDLYDIYYWYANVGVLPDMETLKNRLGKINSRIPKLKKIKSMSLESFLEQLESAVASTDEKSYLNELSPVLPRAQLAGSFLVFKTKLSELIARLFHLGMGAK